MVLINQDNAKQAMDDDEWDEWLANPGEYNKMRVWSWNEIVDHPIFMQDVPADISNNPHLLALQSLMYDGETPESLALHFKKMGNEFMEKTPQTAITRQNSLASYSKAIEMEAPDDRLNSILHSNRAQVALSLGEYIKVVDDCRAAVRYNRTNKKAYYRGAKASLELGLARQALKFIEKLREMDPDNKDVNNMYRLAKQAMDETTEIKEKKREEDMKVQSVKDQERESLRLFLKERNIELYPALYEISMYEAHGKQAIYPYLASDADNNASVIWPILFLFGEYEQSDFVHEFDEDMVLGEILYQMFPEDRYPQWDVARKYLIQDICTFVEYYSENMTQKEQLMKEIRIDQPLKEQIKGLRLPFCLAIHVTVRNSPYDATFRQTARFV